MTGTDETPISYRVDQTLGLVVSHWNGEVTVADVERFWAQVLSDPDVLALRRHLADIRAATLHFTGEELRQLIWRRVAPALRGQHWTSAIVVAQPEQFGVSRQFQVFAEVWDEAQIFYDLDEAMRWVASHQAHSAS